jgi:hypothetical protein
MVTKIAISSSHSYRKGASFSMLTTPDSKPVRAFLDLAQGIAAFRDELIRSLPARSQLPRRFTVYVALPGRSIQLCSARETLLDNLRRLKFRTGATASQAPAPPLSSGAQKTCAQPEARRPSFDRADPFETRS